MKKNIIWATIALVASFFAGCSSVTPPKAELAIHNDTVHNIPAIDSLIVSMKQDYIKQCYMPVASHLPPENSCQSDLFQMVERRYHMEYNQNHVAAASNELFFKVEFRPHSFYLLGFSAEYRSLTKGNFLFVNLLQ